MIKSIKKTIITVITFLVIIVGIFFMSFKSIIDRPLKIDSVETINVEEGESFYGILDWLNEQGKIRNKLFVKLYAKVSKINLEVIPGKYILHKDMTINEIAELLNTGSEYDLINFTIPEGFTIEDIGAKLEEEKICTAKGFLNSVNNYELPSFIKDNPEKRYNLEGFLYPDTYKLELDTDPDYIVEIMVKRFKEVWDEVIENTGISVKNENVEKFITIASMIEKESKTDEERATISSVIYNRLKIDMPLQIDATVIYAHGYRIDPVLHSHLEIDSLYNTYSHSELPVGPIANPGKPSIVAALKPDKTNYLFYLLETEDTHYFTDTYEDFKKRKDELGY